MHADPRAARRRRPPCTADGDQRACQREGRVARHRGERAGRRTSRRGPTRSPCSLDFRNVRPTGRQLRGAPTSKSPIAAVRSNRSTRLGAPASRVRITLSQPVAHHVRSDRNTVVVDFDKPSAKAAPYVRRRRRAALDADRDALRRSRETPRSDPIAALGLETARGASASAADGSRPVAAVQPAPRPRARLPPRPPTPAQPPSAEHRVTTDDSSPATRSASTSRAPICAPCCALRGDQRPEHRHRSGGAGHGRRRAARRAVGPGARHHPARQQARLLVDGTIVRIAPLAVLADEETQRRKLADEQALAGAAAGADARRSATRRPRSCSRCSPRARCRSAARCRSIRAPTR